ncbi:MAG: hypothetical protein GF335_03135 [Candidatus Moranbacteria bacterium]|nr:hypothetical protein [Candidatus Moranbacteria bacterium]
MYEKFPNHPDKSSSSEKKGDINRRDFLKRLGVAILSTQLPTELFGGNKKKPPESKEAFDIKRVKEWVIHQRGSFWELQSIGQDSEYYPSFKNSLFDQKETPTSSEISGGFEKKLKINRFGTFAETIPAKEIDEFLSQYKDNIQKDDRLIPILKHLAQDSYVFVVLNQFFKDGGKIKFGTGRGHYNSNPLEIEFKDYGDPTQNESILYHELLHYVFDKENSTLSESYDSGGADHHAIIPLEERFNIIQTIINRGEVPLGEDIQKLYGFTSKGRAGDKIKQFLQNNDLRGLNRYLLSEDFYRNYVHSGMISTLSSVEYRKNHRDFRLKLSNGNTLRIMEDCTLKDSDSIEKVEYSKGHGTFIEVKIKDIENFSMELLNPYIPSSDLQNVKKFLDEHKNNHNLDRGYILTPDQIHDIAYLNACNAIILENAFILAIEYSKNTDTPFKEVFSQEKYKKLFQEFVNQFTLLEQDKKNHFPARKKAENITHQLIQKIQ